MPFDGPESAVTEALDRLTTFFSDESNWYRKEFCRRRGRHSYSKGRRCLSGAVGHAIACGAPEEIRLYVERAVKNRLGLEFGSMEFFNCTTSHAGLLAMLCEARDLASAKPRAKRRRRKVVEEDPVEVAARWARNRRISRRLLFSMKPTMSQWSRSGELALMDDMIAFFEKPKSRISGFHSGATLNEVMQHFRSARGLRGDRTACYLRRAFRGTPWTFGSLRAFDMRSAREDILTVLALARELAVVDMDVRPALSIAAAA
jgi:hypothetical protein